MDDWEYCIQTLPKVSRTFAINISILKGEAHRSILTAYLFCRIVDTIEDAEDLDSKVKVELLLEFSQLMRKNEYRKNQLLKWIKRCCVVHGSESDMELLGQTSRVFNVFDSLSEAHQKEITSSVCLMTKGMAYFQRRDGEGLTCLEDENEYGMD